MNIVNWFINPIALQDCNVDLENLINLSYKTKNIDSGTVKSNVKGWQSNQSIDLPEDLLETIVVSVREYLLRLGFENPFRIDSAWININEEGSYNLAHSHPGSQVSGCFYIKVPKNSGNLVFRSPNPIQHFFPARVIKQYNNFSAGLWTIDSKDNLLVLFPSWLEHYVEQNNTKDDRISIAFNITLEDA